MLITYLQWNKFHESLPPPPPSLPGHLLEGAQAYIPYNSLQPLPLSKSYTVSDTKERVMFKYYPHPAHHLSCVWLTSDPSRIFHAFSLATTLMSQKSCFLCSGSSLKRFTASSHPRVLFILLFKQTQSVFQDWVTISVELHQPYKMRPRRCWKNTFLLQKLRWLNTLVVKVAAVDGSFVIRAV